MAPKKLELDSRRVSVNTSQMTGRNTTSDQGLSRPNVSSGRPLEWVYAKQSILCAAGNSGPLGDENDTFRKSPHRSPQLWHSKVRDRNWIDDAG